MSKLKDLKEYLVGDSGYLLDENNNGKTIMLSGAWGAGKTHFWQNEIVKEQKKIKKDGKEIDKYSEDEYREGLAYRLKDKKKACGYVSLYGKPSIESIELDLYMNAYKYIEGDADIISKTCSVFTTLGKNLGNMAHRGARNTFGWLENLVDKGKLKQAGEYIDDGGLICFDDFERKSKDIDLNDLFGFISQLTSIYNCKIVIILNSDVFEGEESNVFKAVKEKTVNKYFYFEPTIEELFNSIYDSNVKYKQLDAYKDDILNAIKKTEELNARIYIQVLDNCLEWIEKGYDTTALKALVFTTIFFILTHEILDYSAVVNIPSFELLASVKSYKYYLLDKYHDIIQNMSALDFYTNDFSEISFNEVRLKIFEELNRRKDGTEIYASEIKQIVIDELSNNEKELSAVWKYGYRLYYMNTVDELRYNIIANFVKTGILLKNT